MRSSWRTYINRADEVGVAHQDVRHSNAKNDGEDPGAHKSFDCFLWGKLYELRASESDTADVGEDVISNDKGCREEEPYHPLEYIVHHEMCLNYDQVEGHMCPGKLCKLKAVVAFLEGSDEEDEACVSHISLTCMNCGIGTGELTYSI